MSLTLSMDGRVTSVPVFIQPDSEQECLLGSNAFTAVGISVVRSNGEHAMGPSKGDQPTSKTAGVNLVQTTTLPGLNSCLARSRAKVELPGLRITTYCFEPDHNQLELSH